MASERLRGAQDLLDLTFQSLAMQHMDLKQVELDTAVAKVDELSRQLESLWTDGPGPPKEPYSPSRTRSPLGRRSLAPETPELPGDALGRPGSPPDPPLSPGGGSGPLAPTQGLGGSLRGVDAPQPGGPTGALARPPAPPPYEMHGLYPSVSSPTVTFRAQDDLMIKRRPQKSWNESDLDVAYEKKPPGLGGYDRSGEGQPGLRPSLGLALAPWRESSLDGAGGQGKDGAYGGHSATLPRNYKVSPLAGERRAEGPFRRSGPGTLPRGWHFSQQPVSRIPVPPQGSGRPVPPETVPPEGEPELERLLQGGETEGLERPLSPTRLQPLLPPEAQRVPEFEEVARVLAEMPRPLKRRGSMEQCPGPALPPTRTRQYQQLITRLLHRPPRRDEPPVPGDAGASPDLPPPTPAAPEARPPRHSPPPQSPSSPERRSALRDPSSPRRRPGARVRLNPLVLLLDAALTGELDVVQQAVAELNDPSQPNDEGITALHNAICGANYSIVDFLIASGANVNSPDSTAGGTGDGGPTDMGTPLHCAASCNDTGVCVALVRHGAAIFATTTSDGSLAVEKCDPYREGYADCYNYLTEVEQSMGVLNSGVVYALWDYSAEFGDELSFREGEPVTVLRRQPQEELDWWWGSLYGHEGYVPRNYFGLFPRVRPQRKKV
ncbi:relA-associated inhibitor [Gavia stellata]|uniref:relA-associated inhibitor n=1 Tax=Gavia stellata TaxID=37040 RepID=UPI00289E9DDF|nr:relA-associated inhibitor [Gavia stellata]